MNSYWITGSAFLENPSNGSCILGSKFTTHCQFIGAVSVKWIYNGREVSVKNPREGLRVANISDRYEIGMECTKERHYATVQCEASLDIFTDRSERSFVGIIKVEGKLAHIL